MGMTTKEILQGVHDWTDGKFSQKDGFYEQMVVGEALALAGQTQRTNDAMYRKSGGSEEVVTGTATIANIKGNTVAWNQLIDISNFTTRTQSGVTFTNNHDGSITLSGTSTNAIDLQIAVCTITANHKYLIWFSKTDTANLFLLIGSPAFSPAMFVSSRTIVTSADNVARVAVRINISGSGASVEQTVFPQIFDLTLIYGAGNEPTTVAQFEAGYFKWFGKPLAYEAYDAGSLRSVQLESLKTTGFNQWDEEWELGGYNGSTGDKDSSVNKIRCKNPIPVFPNTAYCIQTDGTLQRVCMYDAGNSFIGTASVDKNTFTTSSSCRYITFNLTSAGGTTYNHDICINISNPAKNGTYEPYEEHVAPLPVTTLKGKLNGEGESVTIFPDGMNKLDSLYTQGDKTYAVVGGETRAYQEGDATSDTMVTDGVAHTYVALTTPLIYEVEDFNLPKTYLVDGGGTEEQVQKANVQGLAAILTCIYGVDAVGFINKAPQRFIGEDSMDNFLAKLNIATGGTWSKTFNENTGEWDFNYTPAANTNAITNEESI